MSYGRDSPSNCLPHHDEYTTDIELPKRSLLSGYGEERPRSAHSGMRGGMVAARVRSLNAAFSTSVPSLALPKEQCKDVESELNGYVSQDSFMMSTKSSLAVVQNSYSLRNKPSFRARRQCTLIRTRSNPFVRRDSSAASPTPSLKDARLQSRDAPVQSPNPRRQLALDSLNLHGDLPSVSDADLAAAAKGSTKWANLLWDVWTGVKTTLPRQVFIDAVESKIRKRYEAKHPKRRLWSHETGCEDDNGAEIGAGSHGMNKSSDPLREHSLTEGSDRILKINAHLVQSDEGPQQLYPKPYCDYVNESECEDFSTAMHQRSKPQLLSNQSRRDSAILPSENTMSIRSTSPWPDFDDVGYIPSENSDSTTRFSQTTLPSRDAARSCSTAPVERVTPQRLMSNYNCRTSESRSKLSTSSLKRDSANKSISDNIDTHPGTAIAIRLGDMFDAIIISRGDKPLPRPEVARVSGEDQNVCMQDLQQISADLMQRTKELLTAQPLHDLEQYNETENATRENHWQQSHSMFDGTQLEEGLDHHHHHHHPGNYRGSYSQASRRPFSYEDGTTDDSHAERKSYEKVMSVPALLHLIDSTAKDLGLVLKPDEGIAPLRPRQSQLSRGHGLPVIC